MAEKKTTTKAAAEKAAPAKKATATKAPAKKATTKKVAKAAVIDAISAGFKAGDVYEALAAAEKALTGDDAKADYLRAVIAARKGLNSEASKYLKSAASKDEALKARAEKDIEFAAFAN